MQISLVLLGSMLCAALRWQRCAPYPGFWDLSHEFFLPESFLLLGYWHWIWCCGPIWLSALNTLVIHHIALVATPPSSTGCDVNRLLCGLGCISGPINQTILNEHWLLISMSIKASSSLVFPHSKQIPALSFQLQAEVTGLARLVNITALCFWKMPVSKV